MRGAVLYGLRDVRFEERPEHRIFDKEQRRQQIRQCFTVTELFLAFKDGVQFKEYLFLTFIIREQELFNTFQVFQHAIVRQFRRWGHQVRRRRKQQQRK